MPGKIKEFLQKHRTSSAAGGMVALAVALLMWRWARPSLDRGWIDEMERMPRATFDGRTVSVKDIRNFLWSKDGAPAQRYETRTYHSIKNSCTTNLIGHFNEICLCKAFEYGPRAVFSGLSDGLLRELGLIDDGATLKELRKKHAITSLALAYGDGPQYSRAIRKGDLNEKI